MHCRLQHATQIPGRVITNTTPAIRTSTGHSSQFTFISSAQVCNELLLYVVYEEGLQLLPEAAALSPGRSIYGARLSLPTLFA